MNQPNFYGADFGFDSSNSSSTLTLKFDECEAITESSTLSGATTAAAAADVYNTSGGTDNASETSSNSAMMDSLRDNPVLTTASMPIPTRNNNTTLVGGAINPNLCRLPDTDFGLDFDLSQDLNMPQILLMDGSDLNDDSSPTLFGLGNNTQYSDSVSVSSSSCAPLADAEGHGRNNSSSNDLGNSLRDFGLQQTSHHQQQQHQHPQQQQQNPQQMHQQQNQHLLSTANAGHQMWGSDANSGSPFIPKSEPLNLDDDAIYQVDKADLIQGDHFNDDPLLDISIDDISLLEDNHSLQTLHNVMSPQNSCNISPSGYNFYNLQQHHNQALQQQLLMHYPQERVHTHPHNHHHQQLQQLSPQQAMQPTQNLPIHSPSESVSLYETLNRSSNPYNLNTANIVSPPTPTNSLSSHYQSALSSGIPSPRARPISITPTNATQLSSIRKYKTNAANQHTKRSALHDLLRKDVIGESSSSSAQAAALGQSVPGGSGFGGQANAAAVAQRRRLAQYHHMQNSRLSSSAPTQLGMDQLWQRREPRPHLLSTSSVAEAESTSSLSTGEVLSPEAPDFSQDESNSDDSEHYEDFSSDDDSDGEGKLSQSLGSTGSGGGGRKMSKSERYFWQYNVQAKGPKGQRLVIKTEMEDPHVLNEVTDPVFSPNCSVRGIKHSGKARKGDGNDLTPNPRKLNAIGRELDKLFRVINDITPVAELPFNARTKTRKEKNKLASRACRLKKKAQHEANKIKLYGLEVEHKRLIAGIEEMKTVITTLTNNATNNMDTPEDIAQKIERIYQAGSKVKIGGMSTEYVNQMIQKVKGTGMPNM